MVTTLSNDCILIYYWEISLTENKEIKWNASNSICRHGTYRLLSALSHRVTLYEMQLKTFRKTATINETDRNDSPNRILLHALQHYSVHCHFYSDCFLPHQEEKKNNRNSLVIILKVIYCLHYGNSCKWIQALRIQHMPQKMQWTSEQWYIIKMWAKTCPM